MNLSCLNNICSWISSYENQQIRSTEQSEMKPLSAPDSNIVLLVPSNDRAHKLGPREGDAAFESCSPSIARPLTCLLKRNTL